MATMRHLSMPMSSGPSAMRSASSALRMTRSMSLRPDGRRLDQRPPFLDLGLVVGGERRGGLLLGRRNLLAEIGEALLHGGIGERMHGGLGELVHHVRRRSLRHPHAVPGRDIDAGRAGLVDTGNV